MTLDDIIPIGSEMGYGVQDYFSHVRSRNVTPSDVQARFAILADAFTGHLKPKRKEHVHERLPQRIVIIGHAYEGDSFQNRSGLEWGLDGKPCVYHDDGGILAVAESALHRKGEIDAHAVKIIKYLGGGIRHDDVAEHAVKAYYDPDHKVKPLSAYTERGLAWQAIKRKIPLLVGRKEHHARNFGHDLASYARQFHGEEHLSSPEVETIGLRAIHQYVN